MSRRDILEGEKRRVLVRHFIGAERKRVCATGASVGVSRRKSGSAAEAPRIEGKERRAAEKTGCGRLRERKGGRFRSQHTR